MTLEAQVKRLHEVLVETANLEGYTLDGRLELTVRLRWRGPDVDWYATWDHDKQGFGLTPEDAVDDLIGKAAIVLERRRREVREAEEEEMSRCPACGEPIDYCRGHGEVGDPVGARILDQHDNDDHHDCDPRGCDEAVPVV